MKMIGESQYKNETHKVPALPSSSLEKCHRVNENHVTRALLPSPLGESHESYENHESSALPSPLLEKCHSRNENQPPYALLLSSSGESQY